MDPSDQELATFTVLADVTHWIGFEDDGARKAWTSFSACLGKPKMIRQVAAIPLKAYEDATATWMVPDDVAGTVTPTPPTPVELGHVGLLRRIVRMLVNANPDESVAPAPGPASTGGAGIPALVASAVQQALPASSKGKLLVSKVLDQADDSEVELIDAKKIETLLEAWRIAENDGEEPTEEEEATAAQLSALENRIKRQGTTFVDFGIWRPFGNRMGRALKFTVHSLREDGTVAPKELSGPADFGSWSRSWRVFAFAMTVLGQATRTRLSRYHDKIAKLNAEYPRYWWVVGLADIRMRSEYIDRTRRDCVKRHAAGKLPDFDPQMPWDIVFREASLDNDFWAKEVDKKVLLHLTSLASTATLVDDGYGILEEAPSAIVSGTSGGKKKQGKRKRSSSSSSEAPKAKKRGARKNGKKKPPIEKAPVFNPQAKAGKGKGKGKGGKAKVDGRHVRFEGTQICWDYNRQAGGCSEICPMARAHVCELCLGKHRALNCTTPVA